ncbi:MAG: SMP-30/gluconolactonase/LRE family protein [Kangiellaceae bacterium]|nr:SMP-30/gluconolactonase/LRE family protein [Kangiellaceae bacterium]
MYISRKFLFNLIIATFIFSASLTATSSSIQLYDNPTTEITVNDPTIFPESIIYDSKSKRFLISSFRQGTIYEVSNDGQTKALIEDDRLCSVLAIRIDTNRDRLYATNSDMGACTKPTRNGPKKVAALAVYQLSTGQPVGYYDLAKLLPKNSHLANGLTLDSEGNVYITDSFSPTIYRVDTKGTISVFLNDVEFEGQGINLNGIVFHPDGYFLTIKKSTGELYKIPLDAPQNFTKVKSRRKLVGGDGLVLASNNQLAVIANQASGVSANAVFTIKSNDNWISYTVTDKVYIGDVYPTTGTIKNEELYVIHSNINKLLSASERNKVKIRIQAKIKRFGRIK